jgi:serine protease
LLLHATTALGTTGTDNSWVFLVGDYDEDGHPDLWAINRANTGSGTTEVHVLNGTNFQAFLVQTATALQQTGSDNSWTFALG